MQLKVRKRLSELGEFLARAMLDLRRTVELGQQPAPLPWPSHVKRRAIARARFELLPSGALVADGGAGPCCLYRRRQIDEICFYDLLVALPDGVSPEAFAHALAAYAPELRGCRPSDGRPTFAALTALLALADGDDCASRADLLLMRPDAVRFEQGNIPLTIVLQ